MAKLKRTRPVWAEINLDNLAHNIREVRRITNSKTQIIAVVKADGYGHGATMVAKTFLEQGGDRLAVATLSEAIQLRNEGIKESILILGYTPSFQEKEAIEQDIIQTVYNYEHGEAISQAAIELCKIAKIHIKIDTGMSRLGFIPSAKAIEDIIKISKLDNIYIEGIFTHFAEADGRDKEFTREQFERFQWVIEQLRLFNVSIPIKHISNSAAIIDIPEYNLDMVRAGIMMYGLYPSNEVDKNRVLLKPVMTLKASIANIKQVPKGTGVSYGQIYRTENEAKIGTLPIGYADGYTRMLTGKGEVSVSGRKVPVVGKICMDQCMINITEIEDAKIGDEAILFGDGRDNSPHIDEVASKLGTINYEVVCMVGKRVPRIYIKNGEIIKIKDYLLE